MYTRILNIEKLWALQDKAQQKIKKNKKTASKLQSTTKVGGIYSQLG